MYHLQGDRGPRDLFHVLALQSFFLFQKYSGVHLLTFLAGIVCFLGYFSWFLEFVRAWLGSVKSMLPFRREHDFSGFAHSNSAHI